MNPKLFPPLDQHFHKPEVLIFGTVSTLVGLDDSGKYQSVGISHIVSSDYRYGWFKPSTKYCSYCKVYTSHSRVKDHKTVYCLLKKVIQQMLTQAEDRWIKISRIISKVLSIF